MKIEDIQAIEQLEEQGFKVVPTPHMFRKDEFYYKISKDNWYNVFPLDKIAQYKDFVKPSFDHKTYTSKLDFSTVTPELLFNLTNIEQILSQEKEERTKLRKIFDELKDTNYNFYKFQDAFGWHKETK